MVKYWQLSVCLSEEKELRKKFLGAIDLIKHGRDDVPKEITLNALPESSAFFLILLNNYLRSGNVKSKYGDEITIWNSINYHLRKRIKMEIWEKYEPIY